MRARDATPGRESSIANRESRIVVVDGRVSARVSARGDFFLFISTHSTHV